MARATLSASCRSSESESLRSRMRFRIRSRASWNSLSSLACSGQLMARVEAEHIRHLLKTPSAKLAERRIKSKHYFSPIVRLLGGAKRITAARSETFNFGLINCTQKNSYYEYE